MRTPFTSTSVAIAFVALFSCLVLLASCDDLFQPKQVTVVILTPENVTAYSADLVVELTTIDESAMVTLEYTDGVKSEKLESGVYPANKK